jgi:ATP-dependent DNA helicase RecQ
MAEPLQILKQYWGFEQFRPLQEDIIRSVLAGKDTLALMPTGGGKSLCYQVPALAAEGMCLVISPLIALMKDQVENLRKKGITAYAIFSGMTRKEVINVLKVVTESNCKFLYVSPERLETALFKEYLPGMAINLIAVDEAHCISQWGYDFRPPYLRIAVLRDELPGVPVLALTASATPEVQQDICQKLSFTTQHIFRQSFERPNLSYSVFQVHSKINKITEIIQKVSGSGIIYCRSRKRTKEISELLELQKISASYYHAGLTQEERSNRQEAWINNKTRIIVCTNAFGMGIDKPDVRFVIHADVPDSLENYYQEAGRAGRDGKTAYAVLLYDEKGLAELEEMISLRFPGLEDIRMVYQAVANYLQLHTGDGEGRYYDFDISDFLRKFKLESNTVLYSLKALEQDGWLSFNEQVFLSSQVRFTTDKNYLYQFEQSHPLHEPLLKTLLRAYEGIFDLSVNVSEKVIAGLLKKDAEVIKQQLTELNRLGLIEYQPQKDKPQLYFVKPRIKTEQLSIDMIAYNQRKEQYNKRCRQMIRFVKEIHECRSHIIGVYFGDSSIKNCGICDNCLNQKKIILSPEEFEALHHRILNLVKYESLATKDLLQKLGAVKKEKAWKVIEFLQAENKIEMDTSGWVRLK